MRGEPFAGIWQLTELSVDQKVLTTGLLAADKRTLGRNAFVNKDALTGDTIDNQLLFKFNTADIHHTALTGIGYARSYEDHRRR
jgi:hypothetical protein